MNKIVLAMMLAGAAASVQAAPNLLTSGSDASVTVDAPNSVKVSNVLTPEVNMPIGSDVLLATVARGNLSADDGLPHSYAVTFPDDIIDTTSSFVRATVTGLNNPNNKMIIQLGGEDPFPLKDGTKINGKNYMLLENKEGNAEVNYGVYTSNTPQVIKPDTYTIRTQAYIYSE